MDDEGGFSGAVRLTNVSDFIAPAQNCIIPLEKNTRTVEESLVSIKRRTKDSENGTSSSAPKKTIKVSLNDCLACNGCITSAETVLVEEQSIGKLLDGLAKALLSVVTVCPQSVCSIAAKRGISASEAAQLIARYFFSKGSTYVLDSSYARLFALEEAWAEFEEHVQQPHASSAPLLNAGCPGFVCYAEKSHGRLLVPLLSKVRSPQAIMGAIVKDLISKHHGNSPAEVYHATVMPCFDKKLEASRPDFVVPESSDTREVDCVISTAELDAQLDSFVVHVDATSTAEMNGWTSDFAKGNLIGGSGGTSGGYAEYIAQKYIAAHPECEVSTSKPQKNVEVVQLSTGDRCVKIARVYGFRNIQNVVRKLKTNKCDYDYVDVWACPSGCANGGGQIRAETVQERDEILKRVESIYSSIPVADVQTLDTISEWSAVNPNWKDRLHTQYRAVETNIATNLQW